MRLLNRSSVNREVQALFCEGLAGKFRWSTHQMNTRIKKSIIALLPIFFSTFSISQCYAAPVAIGDSLGGGTVFCVSQTPDTSQCMTTGSGEYGLIMANVDQANYDSNSDNGVTWSSEYKKTNAQSDDDGAANTDTIIAAHPNDNGSNNAAWLCHNYNASEGYIGPGMSSWYLPAKNELNKMYVYARENNLIGKNCTGKKDNGVQCLVGSYSEQYIYYWSSTEYSGNYGYAWSQGFSYGSQVDSCKIGYFFGARAVRAFNNSTVQQFNNLAVQVMTGEAIYEQIAEMPRELIGIITGYATADVSRERMEKDRSEIAKCILEAAKGWPKVEREEAERIVKEMEVIAIAKEQQAREKARVKAEQEELKKQEEAKRIKQREEEKQKDKEFLAKGRKILHAKRKTRIEAKPGTEAKQVTEGKAEDKQEIRLEQDAKLKAEEKKSKIEEEKKAAEVRQNVTEHVGGRMHNVHIDASGTSTSSTLGSSLSFPHS